MLSDPEYELSFQRQKQKMTFVTNRDNEGPWGKLHLSISRAMVSTFLSDMNTIYRSICLITADRGVWVDWDMSGKLPLSSIPLEKDERSPDHTQDSQAPASTRKDVGSTPLAHSEGQVQGLSLSTLADSAPQLSHRLPQSKETEAVTTLPPPDVWSTRSASENPPREEKQGHLSHGNC